MALTVTFNQHETNFINRIAHLRNDHKIGVVRNRRICGDDDLLLNVWGVSSELAVAKVLGLTVDVIKRIAGDGGVDLVKDGKIYQVKYTKYPTGLLIFKYDEEPAWNYAILTTPGHGGIEIKGWINKNLYLQRRKAKDLGYGLNWIVEQKQLLDLDYLPGIIIH